MSDQEISPESFLAFVKKSFDVPNEQLIDLMPLYSLVLTVAEWDGEPEDAVPLQLAQAECDEALAQLGDGK